MNSKQGLSRGVVAAFAVGLVVALFAALIAVGVLLSAAFAWLAVEVVAGHDVSFREAVGIALLLGGLGSGPALASAGGTFVKKR